MVSRSLLVWAGLSLLATSPVAQAPASSPASFVIDPLALTVPLNSGEPRLAVQGDRVVLSWIESAGARDSLKFAERTATGWSTPITITSGSNLMVNEADAPVVQPLSNGTLVAAWLQENGPDPEAYDVRVAQSTATGRTWSTPAAPHHDGTETEHGFPSVFDTGAGGYGLIWLDGRSGKDMALRATTYGADGKQREETVIDARVCECCQTAIAVSAEGPIAVFRDRSAGEIRDIYLSRLVAGRWSAPAPAHRDGWKIDGCPVNGPAVAASGRDVAVAWFSAQTTPGHAFVAFSSDAGRTFGAPVRVDDTASTGRVQVGYLGDGSVAVSWIDFSDGRSQFRVRRIPKTGAKGPVVTIADGMGTQYPRMAVRRDEIVLAWTENTRGSTRVRTARAAMPSAFRRPG